MAGPGGLRCAGVVEFYQGSLRGAISYEAQEQDGTQDLKNRMCAALQCGSFLRHLPEAETTRTQDPGESKALPIRWKIQNASCTSLEQCFGKVPPYEGGQALALVCSGESDPARTHGAPPDGLSTPVRRNPCVEHRALGTMENGRETEGQVGWGGYTHTQRPRNLREVTQSRGAAELAAAQEDGTSRTSRTRQGLLRGLEGGEERGFGGTEERRLFRWELWLVPRIRAGGAGGGDQPGRREVCKSQRQMRLEQW